MDDGACSRQSVASFGMIADALEQAARSECLALERALMLARRSGMSQPGQLVVTDESRERYDLLVEGCQLIRALSQHETQIRGMVGNDRTQNPNRPPRSDRSAGSGRLVGGEWSMASDGMRVG